MQLTGRNLYERDWSLRSDFELVLVVIAGLILGPSQAKSQVIDRPGYEYVENTERVVTGVRFPSGTFSVSNADISIGHGAHRSNIDVVRTYSSDVVFWTSPFGLGFDLELLWNAWPQGGRLSNERRLIFTNGVERFEFRAPNKNIVYNDTALFVETLARTAKIYYTVKNSNSIGPGLALQIDAQSTLLFEAYTLSNGEPAYRIKQRVFPTGVEQNFYYDSSGTFKAVANNLGFGLSFNWTGQGSTVAISEIKAFSEFPRYCDTSTLICNDAGSVSSVKYEYDLVDNEVNNVPTSIPLMRKVIYPDGNYDRFTYTSYREGALCMYPMTYGIRARVYQLISTSRNLAPPQYINTYYAGCFPGTATVVSQLLNDGTVITFPFAVENQHINSRAVYIDGILSRKYNIEAAPASLFLPKQRREVISSIENAYGSVYRFSYDSLARVDTITSPEGDSINYGYDSNNRVVRRTFNPKLGSFLNPISEYQSFSANCFSDAGCFNVTQSIDRNNAVTDYAYVNNLLVSKLSPAVNGIRPEVRISYSGRYASLATLGGGNVPSTTPVFVKISEGFCRSSAYQSGGCVNGPSDQVTTVYDYGPETGPNNLALRGDAVTADGFSLRTCYSYDGLGRVISKTDPAANLATCP